MSEIAKAGTELLNTAQMSNKSIEEEVQVLETALARVRSQVILVEDDYGRICWTGEKLLRYRSGAGKGWGCRRITATELARVAPARKVLEILQAV